MPGFFYYEYPNGKRIDGLSREEAEAFKRDYIESQLRGQAQQAINNTKSEIDQIPKLQAEDARINSQFPGIGGGYPTRKKRNPMQIAKDYGLDYLSALNPEAKAYTSSLQTNGISQGISQIANKMKSGNYTNAETGEYNKDALQSDVLSILADNGASEEGLKQVSDILAREFKPQTTVFGNKMNYDTPENRTKNEQSIQSLLDSGKITDIDASIFRNANQGAGVYDLMNKLADMSKSVSTAVREVNETTPGKVNQASQIKTAENFAQKPIDQKIIDDLTSTRNTFANLVDAKNKFNTSFFTPYLGKAIKLSVLKQNNENFSDFMSSLALAMNEYRKQNFGTAQSQQEIANFLDVINTDATIRPENFMKQLNTVMNSIERGYNDKVTSYQANNMAVPDNLKTIKIGSFSAPVNRNRPNSLPVVKPVQSKFDPKAARTKYNY